MRSEEHLREKAGTKVSQSNVAKGRVSGAVKYGNSAAISPVSYIISIIYNIITSTCIIQIEYDNLSVSASLTQSTNLGVTVKK